MSPSRFAAPALVEVRVADLGTVSALRVTTPGMSVVLAQQVPKIPLLEHLAVLVAAQLELVKTAALHLKEAHQAPFVRG